MNIETALTYIPYETHPAFVGVAFDDDPDIAALTENVRRLMENIRSRVKLPSTDVVHLFNSRLVPAIDQLFAALIERNQELENETNFFTSLKEKMFELIRADYTIFAERGTHAYIEHSPAADAIADSLSRDGFWFGQLSPEAVKFLEDTVAEAKQLLWNRYEQEGKYNRESLSINRWSVETQMRFATVFNNEIINNALSNYMGAEYSFGGPAFELSVPKTMWWKERYGRNDESVPSAYYHNDEGLGFPKMICYLSDVGLTNGPTSLLTKDPGRSTLNWIAGRALDTARPRAIKVGETNMKEALTGTELGRRCFARLPREMRSLGHCGNDILAGSPEEAFILANQVIMTGGLGQFVLFDGTRTFHRGGIVEEGHRWAFQCVYERKRS